MTNCMQWRAKGLLSGQMDVAEEFTDKLQSLQEFLGREEMAINQ